MVDFSQIDMGPGDQKQNEERKKSLQRTFTLNHKILSCIMKPKAQSDLFFAIILLL